MYYPFERKITENTLKNENPLVVGLENLKKNVFKPTSSSFII